MRLRDLHPALWRATVCTGLVHTSIGLAFLIVTVPASVTFLGPAVSLLPFRAWGVLSLGLGLIGLSGILFRVNLATHRRVLVTYHLLGVFMATAWAASEAYALLNGNLGLVAAPALWSWLGLSHTIMMSEPPENPLTSRRR